jgi:hypothetical protein
MDRFDPLLRAKKIAEQATQAAGLAADMREHAASRISDMREAAAAKFSDIKGVSLAAVTELVDDFNQHLPALREAGYTLTDVAVELSLIPKVIATFVSAPDIAEERIAAVIAEHHEAKLTIALLRALYSAYKLQNSIQIAGMKPRGIILEIGIAPAVVVKFA